MSRPEMKSRTFASNRFAFCCSLAVLALLVAVVPAGHAQTYRVIYSFNGGAAGATPTDLTIARNGTLYGITVDEFQGNGNVFRLVPSNGGFLFSTLYNFRGGTDGAQPASTLTIGPNGSLYGATVTGGGSNHCQQGCGTVYNLQPPRTICKSTQCYWNETVLHSFTDGDGASPYSNVIFDNSGNLYGSAYYGCQYDAGCVYKLTPSGGTWVHSFAYSFHGNADGRQPIGDLTMDSAGNIYGVTRWSGTTGNGTVFQLVPTGQSSTLNTIYDFLGQSDGGWPEAGPTLDSAGNLYGSTPWVGSINSMGTVYQLAPNGGSYLYSLLYSFPEGYEGAGWTSPLTMDARGSLYGTTSYEGAINDSNCPWGCGTLFKLTPDGSGGWAYTDLHDFGDGTDGAIPEGNIVIDSHGNLFGTTYAGGTGTFGTVWEYTP